MTTPPTAPHEPLTGVIVAGGRSTRFGTDKASAILAGRPLLQWVIDGVGPAVKAIVAVKAHDQVLPEVDSELPLSVVDDLWEGKGPLAGLVAGFEAVSTPLAFAASCDVPLVLPQLLEGLGRLAADADIVIPHVDGFPQPLLAVYRPSTCLPAFREAVEEDRLKITLAFPGLRVRAVREPELRGFDPGLESFRNVNRVDDLRQVEQLLAGRRSSRR